MSYQFDLSCFGEGDGTFEPAMINSLQVNRIIYIYDVLTGQIRANNA